MLAIVLAMAKFRTGQVSYTRAAMQPCVYVVNAYIVLIYICMSLEWDQSKGVCNWVCDSEDNPLLL